MLAIQAGIGALNDIADLERDRAAKPSKPLPSGAISASAASVVALIAVVAGLALSVQSGLPTLTVAVLGLGAGVLYDFRLKGTAWSWVPFALGIPLLPVYAWLGATDTLPIWFGILGPAAVVAGAALAIANALADLDRDRAARIDSVAVALGSTGAWRVHVGLHAIVTAVALGSLGLVGGGGAPAAVAVLGAIAIAAGAILERSISPARRERGWELEAVGVGVLAAGWIAGVASVAG
jgi:4-hydroxybenzoate polyprenyltransferase